MVEYGYFNEDGFLVSKIIEEQVSQKLNEENEVVKVIVSIEEQVQKYIEMGWKPVDLIDESKLVPSSEFATVRFRPINKGDRISFEYFESFDQNQVQAKIEEYKAKLGGSDYKVTKCYEASLTGNSLPYNIDALHVERQECRDKINELEAMLQQ